MITGIIFVCLIEQGFCTPFARKFDTVEECNAVITEVITKGPEPVTGITVYYVCEPQSA